jgi:hypothetical protein
MLKIEIKPLLGIEIRDLCEINLGCNKSKIENLLEVPPEGGNKNQSFYDEYEFRIDYDNSNRVEFIEFLFGPYPEKVELTIYGHNPFKITAEELIQILTQRNSGSIDKSEADYGYAFLNISVGIWREAIPADIEKSIVEMKERGEYENNKIWIEEELEKSRYFWTIGIGKENYYR